jgi:NAD(P)-dependent dehydrogenase (short-subunit alcohol dehydrogenase family)
MNLTILGASGATGHELTRQAVERGHTVTAVVRDPARLTLPPTPDVTTVVADVFDPASIAAAVAGAGVVISTLGVAKGDKPGILEAGARALVAAKPGRIIWMGAFGTGASAEAAGGFTRLLLSLAMKKELPDKVAADTTVLDAGGTVFHCGLLSDGALSATRRTVELADAPTGFPKKVSRATVAAAMLDEAEAATPSPGTLVPLEK